jgi:hypothetical protein
MSVALCCGVRLVVLMLCVVHMLKVFPAYLCSLLLYVLPDSASGVAQTARGRTSRTDGLTQLTPSIDS